MENYNLESVLSLLKKKMVVTREGNWCIKAKHKRRYHPHLCLGSWTVVGTNDFKYLLLLHNSPADIFWYEKNAGRFSDDLPITQSCESNH